MQAGEMLAVSDETVRRLIDRRELRRFENWSPSFSVARAATDRLRGGGFGLRPPMPMVGPDRRMVLASVSGSNDHRQFDSREHDCQPSEFGSRTICTRTFSPWRKLRRSRPKQYWERQRPDYSGGLWFRAG